jgi:hypothetical protein
MRPLLSSLFLALSAPSAAFAVSVLPAELSGLASAEKSYYEKVFDYSMDVMKPNEAYTWKSYGGSGNITPGELFLSKSKAKCRTFGENFNIGERTGAAEGVACKRDGNDGWCRLKKDNALTCAMETPAYNVQMPGMNSDIPTINAPRGVNIASPETPNVDPGNVGTVDKPSGNDVADSVTGTAGSAGVSATKGILGWFSSTFR